jgi:hypothetical protein
MDKKTSKYLVLMTALLVFSFLLASCQSMIASTEEMNRKRAIDAWGANLTAQGERYLEEMNRKRAIDIGGANLTAQGERYLEEMKRFRAMDAWEANLTAQGERYFEEMEQASVPVYELSSDAPAEAEVMVDAFTPGIEIQRTMQSRTIETVYTVMSDGPGWVVFHADKDGVPGAILEYVWVSSGTSSFARTKILEEMRSEPIHVMLHHDLGWTSYFEFPRTDGPVLVDNEMVNELCFCPY